MLRPAIRNRYGPRTQPGYRRSMDAMPQTRPAPVLGSLDQASTQRVALHVAAHRQKMIPLFYGKRLESALIDWPCSLGVIMGVPAPHMGHRQPLHMGTHG